MPIVQIDSQLNRSFIETFSLGDPSPAILPTSGSVEFVITLHLYPNENVDEMINQIRNHLLMHARYVRYAEIGDTPAKPKVNVKNCTVCKTPLHHPEWINQLPNKQIKAYRKYCKDHKIKPSMMCCDCYANRTRRVRKGK